MTPMRQLYFTLCNDLSGFRFEEMDDYEGYVISSPDNPWPIWTVYCGEKGFSSYRVENDLDKGIKLSDETPIVESVSAQRAVASLVTDARRLGLIKFPPSRSRRTDFWPGGIFQR